RDRESGISAQHHVPLVKIPASALELRESHHGEKTSRVGRPQRVCWQCHVREHRPQGLSTERQPSVRSGQSRWGHGGEDPGGRGELPGKRYLRGRCRDRGTPVPLVLRTAIAAPVWRGGTLCFVNRWEELYTYFRRAVLGISGLSPPGRGGQSCTKCMRV